MQVATRTVTSLTQMREEARHRIALRAQLAEFEAKRTMARAQLAAYARNATRTTREFFVPSRFAVPGVWIIDGPSINFSGNPVDGMYVTDDFGQLVRTDSTALTVTGF